MWVHSKLTGATVEIINEDVLRTISRDPNYEITEEKPGEPKKAEPKKAAPKKKK